MQQKDIQLEMAINQGYVKKGCSMAGQLVMMIINSGETPCKGCNCDKVECGVYK